MENPSVHFQCLQNKKKIIKNFIHTTYQIPRDFSALNLGTFHTLQKLSENIQYGRTDF